jgi:redox-sensitive bicupin YhaK (pirin superfamily)
MFNILPARAGQSFGRGPFQIRRMRPVTIVSRGNDPAFGPLSVIDHANLGVGTLVRMHEHNNDEILSYMWRGTMVQEDSAGHRIAISPRKLMMMNAGKSFFHEESTPDGTVEMLQIFIRPREADLPGNVQFFDRPDNIVDGQWHLIAGPEASEAPLKIRQQVIVYDAHLMTGDELTVPTVEGLSPWVYVMDGAVTAGTETLGKGDAMTDLDQPLLTLRAEAPATLVAFPVDRTAPASQAGTISGR